MVGRRSFLCSATFAYFAPLRGTGLSIHGLIHSFSRPRLQSSFRRQTNCEKAARMTKTLSADFSLRTLGGGWKKEQSEIPLRRLTHRNDTGEGC
jgi:hypothetical protein